MGDALGDAIEETTRRTRAEVAGMAAELLALSHGVHNAGELRFEEHRSAELVAAVLQRHGFEVSTGVAGMPTAFVAEHRFGRSGPTVAIFCEYDALEGIGHGCGHNIIAAAGVGAGVAAARWLARRPHVSGRLLVVGSPGEEGGGGKVRLIEAGVLAGVDAALMVHPAGFDAIERTNPARVGLEVHFHGRAAHAAAAPDEGRNALDGVTLLLVAIGLLRQQLRSDARVHAIVTSGGDAVNVIPDEATVRVFLRAVDGEYLDGRLRPALVACCEGAALATGTLVDVRETTPAYQSMRPNPVLCDLARRSWAALGRDTTAGGAEGGASGSTDMGNVSEVVPAIHPYICVTPGGILHSRPFVEAAVSPDGDRAVLDGAAAVGAIASTLLEHPDLLADAWLAHRRS